MEVLDVLAEARTPLGLGEVVNQTGLSRTTTHRILSTLVSKEFVEQGDDHRYAIGIRLFQIGHSFRKGISLSASVLPVLRDLAATTHEIASLSVQRDWGALCIERVVGRHATPMIWEVGSSLPLHIGAAGRCLLASLCDEDIDEYVARNLEPFTASSITGASELWEDVNRTRGAGVAIAIDDGQIGTRGFAAPVYDADQQPIACVTASALNINVPREREDDLVDKMRRAGAQASHLLGCMKPPDLAVAPRARALPQTP